MREFRVGMGVDTHAFVTGAEGLSRETDRPPLRLAGLDWPGVPPLAGHSDGDVACHAVVDALLSAAGLGSIGELVGVDFPETRDARSTDFVERAVDRLREAGWVPVNVSVQVVAERPRFSPRRTEAEARLSALVGAPVSISATTTDGLGFTGRGEGIAALATALVRRA